MEVSINSILSFLPNIVNKEEINRRYNLKLYDEQIRDIQNSFLREIIDYEEIDYAFMQINLFLSLTPTIEEFQNFLSSLDYSIVNDDQIIK